MNDILMNMMNDKHINYASRAISVVDLHLKQ